MDRTAALDVARARIALLDLGINIFITMSTMTHPNKAPTTYVAMAWSASSERIFPETT